MKVAIASTATLALPSIEALITSKHQFVGVITKADTPMGRGRHLTPNPLVQSLSGRFPIIKVEGQSQIRAAIAQLQPDLVIAISFGNLIKSDALADPKYGWLNLHFSLLPKYRGAAPVQWALLNGETETGVTVFKLDEGMDTGPIYAQRRLDLVGNERCGSLLERLSQIGVEALLETLDLIEAGVAPTQQRGSSSRAPKISKSDARINWNESAQQIDRLIRAMDPEPGAWAEFRNSRIRFGKVEVSADSGLPGSIIHGEHLAIATGSGSLLVHELQPEGKRMMSSAEWARGARLTGLHQFK